MSLGSFIRKQFIDVLQWTEDTDGVLAWRYPMEDQEIQYGGKLTVRETQVAIFVNEGKVADVFSRGCTLETNTLRCSRTLKNWDKFFQSPFRVGRLFLQHAAAARPALGHRAAGDDPRSRIRLRARVRHLLVPDRRCGRVPSRVSGTRAQYTVDDLEQQLRNRSSPR